MSASSFFGLFTLEPIGHIFSLVRWKRLQELLQITARWYGLAGRRLVSIGGTRLLVGDYISRQDEYAAETTVDVSRIEDNLPEIVGPLIVPLYERFSFFRLPSTLVAEELAKMKSRRF
jgi:hypothetical protein